MSAETAALEILLHGRPIGTIAHIGDERTLFAFDEAFVADPARPTLGLGFKDRFGELITGFRPTRRRLSPFFSNLLPEGRMRAYLAERAGVNPEREFFLLRALGRDLPGALTVRPARVNGAPAIDQADDAPPRPDEETALRFSLAGVQLKFSALMASRGGLTIPASGAGGDWIVKLPSPEFDGVPENEFSMMSLARRIGMDVPETRLVALDAVEGLPKGLGRLQGQALAIRRFDRGANGEAIHMEDFAQTFGVYPEAKYKKASYRTLATVLGAETALDDVVEFIRRLTFSMLIGNADMHLKNWSLIYPDRRRAALAPACDFVSTVAYIPDGKAALTVSRSKRFADFTEDELSHLAAKAALPETPVLEAARETVALFHQHWRVEKGNLPLAPDVVEAIERQLRTVPLAKA